MPETRSRITTLAAIDAFFGGVGFVMATPRVWGLAAVPAVMLVFVFGGFLTLGVWGATELDRLLFGTNRGSWGTAGYWIVFVFLIFIAFLIALLMALALTEPFAGFALVRISRAQQRALTGTDVKPPLLIAALWLSVCCVSFAVLLGGSTLVLLMLINLVYPPAVVVTVPLKLLICAWMLAWDLLDYPLGLRGQGLWRRLKWVTRHFGAFTLFGLIWAMVAFVPGVILVLLPMGVAGATRLVLQDDPRPPNPAE